MQLSRKGLEAIKFFEGLKLEAYEDSAGIPTIGYGTIRIDGKPVKLGMKITAEQAEQYLLADVEKFVAKLFEAIVTRDAAKLAEFGLNTDDVTIKSMIEVGKTIFTHSAGEMKALAADTKKASDNGGQSQTDNKPTFSAVATLKK